MMLDNWKSGELSHLEEVQVNLCRERLPVMDGHQLQEEEVEERHTALGLALVSRAPAFLLLGRCHLEEPQVTISKLLQEDLPGLKAQQEAEGVERLIVLVLD